MLTNETEQLKHVADVGAVGVTIAAMTQWIPTAAALASLIWALIRIYETDTIQKLIKRVRGIKEDKDA